MKNLFLIIFVSIIFVSCAEDRQEFKVSTVELGQTRSDIINKYGENYLDRQSNGEPFLMYTVHPNLINAIEVKAFYFTEIHEGEQICYQIVNQFQLRNKEKVELFLNENYEKISENVWRDNNNKCEIKTKYDYLENNKMFLVTITPGEGFFNKAIKHSST